MIRWFGPMIKASVNEQEKTVTFHVVRNTGKRYPRAFVEGYKRQAEQAFLGFDKKWVNGLELWNWIK